MTSGLRLERLLTEACSLSGEEAVRGLLLLGRRLREEVEGRGGRLLLSRRGLLLLLSERVLSEESVRRYRRHGRLLLLLELLLLLLRESRRLRHEHALPERVEARRLGLKLLLLLLRRHPELRLLRRREATTESCEPSGLRLELHRHLLLTEGRGLLAEELRLTGLLLLKTSGERVEGGLLFKVGRGGTGNEKATNEDVRWE